MRRLNIILAALAVSGTFELAIASKNDSSKNNKLQIGVTDTVPTKKK